MALRASDRTPLKGFPNGAFSINLNSRVGSDGAGVKCFPLEAAVLSSIPGATRKFTQHSHGTLGFFSQFVFPVGFAKSTQDNTSSLFLSASNTT